MNKRKDVFGIMYLNQIFLKKEIKFLQKEILELKEENNNIESEYLYLKILKIKIQI